MSTFLSLSLSVAHHLSLSLSGSNEYHHEASFKKEVFFRFFQNSPIFSPTVLKILSRRTQTSKTFLMRLSPRSRLTPIMKREGEKEKEKEENDDDDKDDEEDELFANELTLQMMAKYSQQQQQKQKKEKEKKVLVLNSFLGKFIPSEIIEHVFKHLSAEDVANSGQTCKIFRQVARRDSIWKRLYFDRWRSEKSTLINNNWQR